jgi:L-ascorbate metabolism protein UlaG (beta-lactamase superfamily)
MTLRLNDDLRLEPLIYGWPAWWCNVAPGTAGLHALRFQIPALRSYLRNPSAHVRAANDPRLAGGSFVGVPEEERDRVAELLAAMEREYAADCAFGSAWMAFNEHLRTVAVGQTMEPFYADVPPELGGLVELGYDYDNRPSVRFDEALAWRSSLYRRERQRLRLCRGSASDARSFYMSTPVFARDGNGSGPAPFGSAALLELLDLDVRDEPAPGWAEERVAHLFPGLPDPAASLTGAPRPPRPSWSESRVRVRYFGHACLLVEHAGRSVLLDPLIPQGAREPGVFGLADLPERIDLALVTHAHPDHFDIETLVRLRPRVARIAVPRSRGQLIGDVSLRRVLLELGYRDVVELDSGDRVDVGDDDGEVVALPFLGEHGDVLHGSKAIYWVRFGTTTLLAAADSACLDERTYRRARDLVGSIGHVFMNTEVDGAPISWPFDALFPAKRDRKVEATRKCRGSNVAEALRMLAAIDASHLYIYAMGLEPWVQRITGPASAPDSPRMKACEELIARASERDIAARRLAGPAELIVDPA